MLFCCFIVILWRQYNKWIDILSYFCLLLVKLPQYLNIYWVFLSLFILKCLTNFFKIHLSIHRKVINNPGIFTTIVAIFFNDTVFGYFRIKYFFFMIRSSLFWYLLIVDIRSWYWRKLDYKFKEMSISEGYYHIPYVYLIDVYTYIYVPDLINFKKKTPKNSFNNIVLFSIFYIWIIP